MKVRRESVGSSERSSRAVSHGTAFGFTLVELVTTLVLIGILGAIAVPRIFGNSVFVERGYVGEVASAIRAARRVAEASDCAVTITINAADYSAFQRDVLATCNLAGTWNQPVLRGDGTELRGTAPSGIVVAPSPTAIEFARDGSIAGGAPAVIAVGAFTISVDAFGGAVTVTP